eukprot:354773-Chlamydomonas_euryale.AAC.3
MKHPPPQLRALIGNCVRWALPRPHSRKKLWPMLATARIGPCYTLTPGRRPGPSWQLRALGPATPSLQAEVQNGDKTVTGHIQGTPQLWLQEELVEAPTPGYGVVWPCTFTPGSK